MENSEQLKYGKLVWNANSAIICLNHEGEITFINEFAKELFGYSTDEVMGKNVSILIPERESTGANLSAFVQDMLTHPEYYENHVNENIRKNGERIWMAWTNKPIYDSSGQLVEIFSVGIDVTEHKRTEEALRASEERYRQLADSMPQLVWTASSDGIIDYFNSKHIEYRGITQLSNGSWNWESMIHPEDKKSTETAFARALSTGEMFQTEHRMQMADGSYRWHLTRAVPAFDSEGRIVKWYGTATDIHDQKSIEEDLRISEERFRTVANVAGITIAQLNTEHRYLWLFNPHSDFKIDEIIGKIDTEILPDKIASKMRIIREKAINTGEVVRAEIMAPLSDGMHYYDLIIDPLKDARGVVTSVISSAIDVTEKKMLEDHLRKLKEQAEAANRAKTEFLAHMSHEFRTPLGGIIGISDLILPKLKGSEYERYISLIRDSAHSLLGIIGDVLDLSQIESGKVELNLHDFSLASLIQSCIETFRIAAEQHGLSLSASIDEQLPDMFHGDSEKIAQVLRNLISNAVKYTEFGSVIVFASEHQSSPDGMLVVFSVKDTGPGIAPEKQEIIFHEFVRIASEHGRIREGTGLGLAIAKRLVNLMGGELWVESEVGKGSTFCFTVPLRIAPSNLGSRYVGSNEEQVSIIRPQRILLAEDTFVNRIFLEAVLRDAGHSVSSVENGRDAVEAVMRERFDVVLMDIQMPDMDGLEATKRIRALPCSWNTLPIIALTAYAMKGDRKRMLAAGMNEYITKPVDIPHLMVLIGKVTYNKEKK